MIEVLGISLIFTAVIILLPLDLYWRAGLEDPLSPFEVFVAKYWGLFRLAALALMMLGAYLADLDDYVI